MKNFEDYNTRVCKRFALSVDDMATARSRLQLKMKEGKVLRNRMNRCKMGPGCRTQQVRKIMVDLVMASGSQCSEAAGDTEDDNDDG